MCRLTSAEALQLWQHDTRPDELEQVIGEMARDPVIALDLVAEGGGAAVQHEPIHAACMQQD